jgi:hypothetical protein
MPAPVAAATGARAAALAWSERRWLLWLLVAILGLPLALAALLAGMIGGLTGELESTAPVEGYGPSQTALSDIPALYLRTYVAAGAAYSVGWEYLAAIGKVETDHGRAKLPGVKSGVNAYGCCAGPMQFNVTNGPPSTWDSFGVDGNKDGAKLPYDPEDAIPSAAEYLKASGAPGDWDKAIFAYNHASWYVAEVKAWAERYRGAAITGGGLPAGSPHSQRLPDGGPWLIPIPGPGVTCDRRIAPDVIALTRRYRLHLGDCFAMSGHDIDGEHPLGLGLDVHPGPGGSWELVGELARDLGWRESCGATGCAGQLPAPFRFIGWNGYPLHGDPAHAGANAHLHLSWEHTPAAPGTPAERVQTLLPPPGDDKKP